MKRNTGLRIAALAAATTLAIIGIGACTSSGGGDSSGGGGAKAGEPAVPARAGASAAAAPDALNRTSGGGSASKASAIGDVALTSAKIRRAEMTVAVKRNISVAAQADNAEAIVLRNGGEVDADERTSGSYATATLVLRVPPEDLAGTLTSLSKLGVERSRHLSTEDVTSKVADVTSRVTSAREAIVRLRDLYSHATKIADVITVESELSDRESDLEALEAQQRSLAAQTATATVTLSLIRQAAVTHPPKPAGTHHHSGFIGGLQSGWHAFSRGAGAVATALGAVLPFAVLFVALALIGRLLWPRLRPVRQPVPSGPAPE